MLKIPKIAINIVADFEGLYLDQYLDAEGIPTIGYGHTAEMRDGELPLRCTEQEALVWLEEDMCESAQAVHNMVKVPLNDDQFGALVSLCFNIGQGKLSKDSIIRKLNAYDYKGAFNDFWMWRRDKAPSKGGVILEGLQKRRSAERHYALTGEYYSDDRDVLYAPGGKLFYDEDTE